MSINYDTMSISFGNVIKLSLIVSNNVSYFFYYIYNYVFSFVIGKYKIEYSIFKILC